MGLGGIAFLKKMLRSDPRFASVMWHASYSSDRNHERPKDMKTVGKGLERGFDVAIVELMLRKYALLKRCRSIEDLAEQWRNLALEQQKRFSDATTMIFLFDDETNVPMAKGKTQRKRRESAGGDNSGLTAEEQVILGPYRYLCNNNPAEFNRRVNGLFEWEASRRGYNDRTSVTAFELFMTKHMRTAGLREDELEFATRCIASAEYAHFSDPKCPKRIIVDRGVWRKSYERGPPSKDQYRGGAEPWNEAVAPSFPDVRNIPKVPQAIYRQAYMDIQKEMDRYLADERGGCGSDKIVRYLERLCAVAVDAFKAHRIRFEDLPNLIRDRLPQQRTVTTLLQSGLDLYNNIGSDATYGIDRVEDIGDYYDDGGDDDDDDEEDRDDGNGRGCDNEASRCWILIDGGGVRRLNEMDGSYIIGEADLKIPHYARLFAGSSIFVVCHDTDLLPILLMTVKDWIPKRGQCPGKLVLDMTTPSDVKKRPPLPGVVDIIALWRVIHEWFRWDFREIRNPVEVFCLMIILMGTDYLQNPPMLGPATLWKAFSEKKLYKHLARSVATDGHMGSALPLHFLENDGVVVVGSTKEFASGSDGGGGGYYNNNNENREEVVRLLSRDLRGGAFTSEDQEGVGLKKCRPGQRVPGIEVYESAVRRFLLEAYSELKGKMADKWPPEEWFSAQARRVSWQMAYWYQGDTIEGRMFDDEMAQESGVSIYGWHWIKDGAEEDKLPPDDDDDDDTKPFPLMPSSKGGETRPQGCLGRKKPKGYVSEPAPTVVSIQRFREIRKRRQQSYRNSKQQHRK